MLLRCGPTIRHSFDCEMEMSVDEDSDESALLDVVSVVNELRTRRDVRWQTANQYS